MLTHHTSTGYDMHAGDLLLILLSSLTWLVEEDVAAIRAVAVEHECGFDIGDLYPGVVIDAVPACGIKNIRQAAGLAIEPAIEERPIGEGVEEHYGKNVGNKFIEGIGIAAVTGVEDFQVEHETGAALEGENKVVLVERSTDSREEQPEEIVSEGK